MPTPYIYLIGLFISSAVLIILLIYIIRIKRKRQIHYCLLGLTISMTLMTLGLLVSIILKNTGENAMFNIKIAYVGPCTIPVFVYYIGIVFTNAKIKLSAKHLLLWVIPIITTIIIWTDSPLFYAKYSQNVSDAIMGPYAYFHYIYSYLLIFIGMYKLISFSIRNSGFFSKQSLLFVIGSLLPLLVNIMYTYSIIKVSFAMTPILFTFWGLCIAVAILKFRFLNIIPIAIKNVIEVISDCFIVISKEYKIVNFNKPFLEAFGGIINIKKGDNFISLINQLANYNITESRFKKLVEYTNIYKKSAIFEKQLILDKIKRIYNIELTPLFSHKKCIGFIVILKDITSTKNNLVKMKKKQKDFNERERLSSLGWFIGNITNSLNEPILSISQNSNEIRRLANLYRSSINGQNEAGQDIKLIAHQLLVKDDEIDTMSQYIISVLSNVKKQVVADLNSEGIENGTI